MITAVLFDLDDTIFPQAAWLDGAWAAVCAAAEVHGVDPVRLRASLDVIASEGTARGRIIDRALALVGGSDVPVGPLVEAFRSHRPDRLPCYEGAAEAMAELRTHVPVGLVTDGDVGIQHAKLRALGLHDAFDAIVLSDSFGRDLRKPHPVPFLRALEALGAAAPSTVFVGDNPEKDICGSMLVGMRAVRVLTGEHAHRADGPRPWMVAADVAEAVDLLRPHLTAEAALPG